ncbi:MAG TPA: response regulator [Thermoanaerobaculia bacterium]|jgi:DNA-binding response OmpR family regulator
MSAVPAKVLIVDDDPAIRQILSALLKRDGTECDIAEDGEAAIGRLRHQTYDVVLLDLLMPRVDGLGVISYMKESGITTPVVVISAVMDDRVELLDPQLVRVAMQKPLEPRELRRVVEAIVRHTR